MAEDVIDISFSSINSNMSKIDDIATSIGKYSSSVSSAWNKLDSRIKNKVSNKFDTSRLDDIKERLENISTFLGIVVTTYQSANIDLNSSLSIEQLMAIYPNFAQLSDERKAIVISALRYLGLNGAQVMKYGQNFSSEFAKAQFRGNAVDHAWCAMFVGSMVSYFFGTKSGIINPSYASVWKIIGNYNNQVGIAFNPDDRVHYYLSQAGINKYDKYLNSDGSCGLKKWESNLARYNASHGTNLKVTDWINRDYIPQAGDIVTFNGDYKGNPGRFYNVNDGTDYPNSVNAYTHIGFVLGTREVNGVLYVDTVEGNVHNDVEVRSFRADDPYLVGYGHIEYEKFYSDQTAVQKTISSGVDVNASKATVGLMATNLLGFSANSKSAKEAYLVNLANNMDNLTGATVTTSHRISQNTDTTTSVVTTSANTDNQTTTTNVVNTSQNNNSNNNYNYSNVRHSNNNYSYSSSSSSTHSSSSSSQASSPATTQTAPSTETKPSTSTTTETKPSTETNPSTSTTETKPSIETKPSTTTSTIKKPTSYVYKPKEDSKVDTTSETQEVVEQRQEVVEQQQEVKQVETKVVEKTEVINNNNSSSKVVNNKPVNNNKKVYEEEPIYEDDYEEDIEFYNSELTTDDIQSQIDNNMGFEDENVIVNPPDIEPIIEEPQVTTPTIPEQDNTYEEPTNPQVEEPKTEEPVVVANYNTQTSSKTDNSNNHFARNIAIATLGIATAGVAVRYAVGKKKESEEE